MYKRIFFLIIIFFSIKQLFWVGLVPLWHFPDEQAHFGQIAYIAETGNFPPYHIKLDLTEEIRKSEEILGTERDIYGNNLFTYHPEYKIPFSSNFSGLKENELLSMNHDLSNRRMTKQESSSYPSFYYSFLGIFYRIFYLDSIIDRVFIIRLVQLIFFVGTLFLTNKIGNLFFYDRFYSISLVMLVGFHPMFSFVAAGINSDNIGNFVFTYFLYIFLCVIRKRMNYYKVFFLIVTSSLITLYFKPQFIITLPMGLLVAVIYFFKCPLRRLTKVIVTCLITFTIYIIIRFVNLNKIEPFQTVYYFQKYANPILFLDYVRSYVVTQLYHEVLPWYWGIFDWLGVTYPRVVHRIINIVSLITISGFAIFILKNISKFKKWPMRGIIFLLVSNLLLVAGIYAYDWQGVIERNIHIGVQGRYFYPLIVTHLLFMMFGIKYIFAKFSKNIAKKAITMSVLLMALLHTYAQYLVAKTYYDLSTFNSFIITVSQYKPLWFKGSFVITLFLIYIVIALVTLVRYLRLNESRETIILS